MSAAANWNIAGIVVSVAGVLLLFRYGMPYRTRTGGASALLLEERDEAAVAIESRYDILGWIGLVLLITGAVLQIVGNLVS